MPRDARLDAVGVALAQLVRPGAVADVELAGRVALDPPRELLQLDPEEARPGGRPGRVHRQRLADDDGRLGRQQPAVRLVDGPRDAVEARRQVHDRGPRRAARRPPSAAARRARSGSASRSGRSESARPCPRSPRAARRRAGSASRCRRPRAPRTDRSPSAVRDAAGETRSTWTPVSQVPPHSRMHATSASASLAPPPRGIGMPPSCTATAITCAM